MIFRIIMIGLLVFAVGCRGSKARARLLGSKPQATATASPQKSEAAKAPQPAKKTTARSKAKEEDAAPSVAVVPPGSGKDIVAIVQGSPVGIAELRPLLIEAAGADILSEVTLDRRIGAALADQGIKVTEQDILQEKSILLQQLSLDPDEASRLLDMQRKRLGLGPRRFELLLKRNAGLRKLIASQVQISDALVQQAYQERYAEQAVCRMILVETLKEASDVMRRLVAGESFTDLAINVSKDSSRNQGGLLPPISRFDPTFPAAISTVASRMEVGQITDPIAIDGGFAILKCERKIAVEAEPFEKVQAELKADVRIRIERSLMQRQMRVMLEEADVTVLDGDLDRDFRKQLRESQRP